jgi:hypothetical protein
MTFVHTFVPIVVNIFFFTSKGTKEKTLLAISAKFKDFYRHRENKNHCYQYFET